MHLDTNECHRQHFQGLRRGMEKGEAPSSTTPSNNNRSDPTFNPITRRPGPGRGRPRKNANAAPAKQSVPAAASASMAAHGMHVAPDTHLTGDLGDLQVLQAVSQDPIGLRRGDSSKGPHNDDIVIDPQVEGLDADADGEEDDFGAADMRPSKRQRVMDGGVDLGDHDAGDILDDEAVLALAAHNTGDVFSPDDEV